MFDVLLDYGVENEFLEGLKTLYDCISKYCSFTHGQVTRKFSTK